MTTYWPDFWKIWTEDSRYTQDVGDRTSVVYGAFFEDSKQFGMAGADINRQLVCLELVARTHGIWSESFWWNH